MVVWLHASARESSLLSLPAAMVVTAAMATACQGAAVGIAHALPSRGRVGQLQSLRLLRPLLVVHRGRLREAGLSLRKSCDRCGLIARS
mmetsp:Transcript_97963/g.255633  ORF Transcript_97963/g.255633 Transcript_97963/m.255633 type:complete len:89 (+) Transcript_97963:181-447(+)